MNDPVALWEGQMAIARDVWDATFPDCDAGPIARTGVAFTPISTHWAMQLLFLFLDSPSKPLLLDDHRADYMAEPREGAIASLNSDNDYHAVGKELMGALGEFVEEHVEWITDQIAHPWSICSVRTFALRPRKEWGGKHFDGWPKSIRKAFILPAGATREHGSTWFGLRDGTEMVFEHPDPCLVLFENSLVEHCPVPGSIYRPTIEFDFVPSARTDPTPIYAGLNGWFPWQPVGTA